MTFTDIISSIQPSSSASKPSIESAFLFVEPRKYKKLAKKTALVTNSTQKEPSSRGHKTKKGDVTREIWLTREYCVKMFHAEPADVPREKVLDYMERHKMKWEAVSDKLTRFQNWDNCWYGVYVEK